MKEFIICAAIRIDETNKIFYGHRHSHAIEALNSELKWKMTMEELSRLEMTQGFITNLNRFVDREEALKIALENKQVQDEFQIRGNKLYSENLY